MQQQNHVQMSKETIHHHDDHERYDQVQYDQEPSGEASQFDTLSISELVRGVCVATKGKSDHYLREAAQPIEGDAARIQMDFMFVGAQGTFVDEPKAKATVLMVIFSKMMATCP